MPKPLAPFAARLVLGLVFFVFGLNGFLGFLPTPEPTGDAAAFMGGLFAAGYFFPLLKATEILVGLSLLSHRFVPLALVVLAPITVQIAAFHLVLDPGGAVMGLVLVALHAYLGYAYRDAFAGVLRADARPAEATPSARAEPAAA